jgi:hypothetical protein
LASIDPSTLFGAAEKQVTQKLNSYYDNVVYIPGLIVAVCERGSFATSPGIPAERASLPVVFNPDENARAGMPVPLEKRSIATARKFCHTQYRS